MPRKQRKNQALSKRPQFEELEPRILYSADLVPHAATPTEAVVAEERVVAEQEQQPYTVLTEAELASSVFPAEADDQPLILNEASDVSAAEDSSLKERGDHAPLAEDWALEYTQGSTESTADVALSANASINTASSEPDEVLSVESISNNHPDVQTSHESATTITSVVLIDTQLDDSETLINSAAPGSIIFAYDGTQESAASLLGRISNWAETGQNQIQSLSILSHGTAGAFELGNQWITAATLSDHAEGWSKLASHFTHDADIYVLGCDVGADGSGQELIDRLAAMTNADVFASDDVTGVGGDWDLELKSIGASSADQTTLAQIFDISELKTADVSLAWYNTGWLQRQAVTIDQTMVTGTSDLSNFAVLISVTDANLRSTGNGGNVGQADGGDILFTSADGTTKLDHQIERYDATTGTLVAWVKVPTLSYNADTDLFLYYGNAGAADQWNDAATWDANYKGVWHLGDDYADSTSAGNDATNNGAADASAQIGAGDDFDGSSSYISTPSTEAQSADDFTLSVWFKADSTTFAHHLLWEGELGEGGWGSGQEMHLTIGEIPTGSGTNPDLLTFFLGADPNSSDTIRLSTPFTDTSTWHHVAVVVSDLGSSPAATMYLDGTAVSSDTGTTADTSRANWDTGLQVGRPGTSVRYFDGGLDEVRLATTALTADWINTEYRNQSAPATYVTFSAEQQQNTAPVLTPTTPTLTTLTEDQTTNSGDLVSAIVGSSITDANTGDPEGIAITATDNSNGSWEYSTDGGTVWTAIGSVSDSSALLLDASDKVRFVPDGLNADTATFTYRAWDQFTGSAGTKVDLTTLAIATESVLDEFNAIAYTGDDGSVSWTNSWQELGEADGASSGAVRVNSSGTVIAGPFLQLTLNAGIGLSRQVDLSSADSATLSFTYEQQNVGAGGQFLVEVFDGTGWNTLQTYDILSDNFIGTVGILETFDISAYVDANTEIRFRTSDVGSSDIIYIDDIKVEYTSVGGGNTAVSSATDTASITVTAVNDAPVFANLDGTPNYTEDGAAQILDSNVTITDVELTAANNFNGATLSLARNGGANAEDVYSNSGLLATLTEGGNLTYNGTTIGSVTTNSGGTLVLTFNNNATNALVNSAMQQIAYSNSNDTPPASVQIDWTFNDNNSGAQGSGGALTATGSTTVAITASNDDPYTSVALPGTVTVTEDVASEVDLSVINLIDPDAGSSSISLTLGTTAGLLTATTGGGVTVTGSGTTSLLLQGSVADLNSFLNTPANISYLHPVANTNGSGADSISVVVNDGGNTGSGGGGNVSLGSVTVDITAVNDAPVNSTPPAQVTPTNTNLVMSLGSGNAIQISDVDAGGSSIQISLNISNGSISLATTANLAFSVGDGSNDSAMTFTGTVADINTALDGMTFSPTSSFNGAASIQVSTSDLGNAGSGGTLTDVDTVYIQVGGVSFQQGDSNGYSGTEDTYIDPDHSGTSYGSSTQVVVDDGGGLLDFLDLLNLFSSPTTIGFLKFDDLFGSAPGQIPVGSTITSASLNIRVTQTDGGLFEILESNSVAMYEWLSPWDESSTYSSVNGAFVEPTNKITEFSSTSGGTRTISNAALVASLNGWAKDPSSNYGWAFLSNQASWAFASSENGTASYRPELLLTYTPPQPPVLANVTGTTAYTENDAATVLAPSLTLADSDSSNMTGATVEITNVVSGEDVLAVGTPGGLTVNWNSGTGILSLSGDASKAVYEAALKSVTYSNSSNNPSTASRTVEFTVNDAYVSSSTLTHTVTITAVNDAPTLSNTGQPILSYSEGDGSVVIDNTLVISDVDDTLIRGATVTIGSYAGAQDILHFTTQNGISGTQSGNTLTLTGNASIANYQAALRSIGYENTSQDPTAGTRTFSFTVNDQTLTSNGVNRSFSISAVNDEQSLDTHTGTGLNEGATAAISNTMLATSDIDNTAAQLTYTVTSAPANGHLALLASPAVPIASFTQDDIDTGKLIYVHDDSETTSDSFDFSVDDGAGAVSSGTFNLSITLLNDNAPVVTGSQSFSLAEDAADSTSVGTVAATDSDTGAVLGSWSIVSGNADGIFQINASTGEITVLSNANLDYENQASYSLGVQVGDGTYTSATENVTVNITDMNDNAPVITPAQSFSVSETAANGTSVGSVTATDADSVGSLQNWSITAGDPGGAFQINASTGEITVLDNTQLDYEASTSYTLTLTVGDGVNTSATETVTINLTDENDTAPVITASQSFSVSELAANATSVGTAVATDADTVGSLQNWTITAGNSDGVFQINAASGEITVLDNTNLDFDTTASYTLTLTVEDGVNTSSTATVTINVTDEAIAVTPGQSFTISESDANGTAVGTIATTGDAPVSFAITGGNTGTAFAIDASGNITIADTNAIDYESATSFSLTIEAFDGTTNDSQTVTVNLTDENDTAPVITALQSFSVSELAANATSLGSVVATDADTVGSLQNWTITAGNTDGVFQINAATGEITVLDNSNLDFDSTASYTLTLTVEDGVNTSSTATVTINVTDEAIAVTPGQSFTLSESDPNGTAVGTIATTGDAPTSFAITAGNTGGAFSIDASGNITINDASAIDYESTTSFSLTIEAFDGTTNDSQTVTVNLTDENDTAPVITASQSFSVSELAANSTSVGTAVATDADTVGSLQSWTITGGNTDGIFQINAATGEITVLDNTNLDFDSTASYALTLTVEDGVNTSSTATVTINVADEAIAVTPGQSFTISESDANGTGVGTVATTGDAPVSFAITAGNTGGAFSIDASGNITIADTNAIDYESATSFSLTIEAFDGTTNDSQTVTVNLTDENDTAPVITASQSFSVSELAANATSVGTAVATDADTVGSLQNWTITAGNTDGIFQINAATGEITVLNNSNLDYDSTSSYTLTLTVGDGVNTSSTETLVVNVLDEVIAVTPGQSFTISESDPNGTAVGTVVTTGDSPTGFTITGGNTGAAFAIDAAGNITINDTTAVDYESATSFTLTVEASDGTNTHSDTVTINLTDLNDTAPVITPAQSFSVSELASNGTSLGNAVATDADTVGSLQNWAITGGNTDGVFQINSSTGEITVLDNTHLDFDSTASYTLSLTVEDGVNTSSVETVTVNVQDEVVTVDTGQTFIINENDANGTVVGSVSTSGDAPTSFAILSGNGGAFSINASGQMTINDTSLIDYESATQFDLLVEAFDGSNTHSALVTVFVTDFDEYNVGAVSDSNGAANTVAEDAAVGSVVGLTGFAEDLDGTDSVSYSLSVDAGGLFAIDPVSGVVTVAAGLDAETDTSHSITVVGTSTDGSFSSQSFTITVTDVDEFDVSPISDTDGNVNAVDENAVAGTTVGFTASASDADQSANTLSYQLLDDAGGLFAIDALSGEITVALPPDYEAASSHTLVVEARSADGSTSTLNVTVQINPLNDNGPAVSDQAVNLQESASLGTQVVDLQDDTTASDVDADLDAISYQILSGNNDGLFAIDATTGAVTLVDTSALNYETTAQYVLNIQSTDGTFTTHSTLTVDIVNVNEAPLITAPSDVSLDEDTSLTFGAGQSQSLSVVDVDSQNMDIEVTLNVDQGSLQLGEQSSLGSLQTSAAMDSFTLRGTLAAVNAALDGLRYVPDADFNGQANLTFNVNDLGHSGVGAALFDTQSISITVIPVNDPGTLDVPEAIEILPGNSISFSTALNNLEPLQDLDSSTTLHHLLLTVENASLTINQASLQPLVIQTAPGTLEASGTLQQINQVLNAIDITPDIGFYGELTLALDIVDEGGSEVGQARSLSTLISINVPTPGIARAEVPENSSQNSEDADVELQLPQDAMQSEDGDNVETSRLMSDKVARFLDGHINIHTVNLESLTLARDDGIGLNEAFELPTTSTVNPVNLLHNDWLSRSMEPEAVESSTFAPLINGFDFGNEREAQMSEVNLAVRLAEIGGSGLLVGSIVWLLKSSSLLSSLLVSYPAWRGMDPLPVLLTAQEKEQREKPSKKHQERHKNHRFQLTELNKN